MYRTSELLFCFVVVVVVVVARADWLLNPARDSVCYLPHSEAAVVLCSFLN